MTQVTFITADGKRFDIDGDDGESLMQIATNNLVPGVIGECGGSCACATCHVYVSEEWMDRVPPVADMERDLLTIVAEPQPNSRLSCQIELDPSLAGLVLNVPPDLY